MRIHTLVLKNFRNHQETVLKLDRFNFIRGPNGCGKSSIQIALEYLFTGRCELTDAAGREAEALIRSGEKEFEVSATLESGETICRRRTSRSQIVEINGKRVPVDAAEAFITKQFGSSDVLSAVLNADRFVEMQKAEQRRLLAQLVDAGKVSVPEEICAALGAIHEDLPKLASVSDVEDAHQRFCDSRTEAHRALKALGHQEKAVVPSDFPNVQEVRKKLDELRQQIERLIAQKTEADVCWQNAQGRLSQVQAEIDEISSTILSPSQEQELLQLESKREHAEKLRQELTELIAEQRTVEKAVATVQGLKDACPTCGQPIAAAAKAKEVAKLRERLADLEGLIRGTREELSEYADIDLATARLETHRNALAQRATLKEEQSQLREVQLPDAGDVDGRMTILRERIDKGERVLDRTQQQERTHETWETYVREKSTLESKIAALDRLSEFFGPNGAMTIQARGRMAPFAEELNRHLAGFGYICSLAFDPFEIHVISSVDKGSGLLLKQLSESERIRFGVAFQIALAMATGLRFVVLDRADILDQERRRLLTNLLVNSGLDQTVVLATSEETQPSILPEGVKFLSLVEVTAASGNSISSARNRDVFRVASEA